MDYIETGLFHDVSSAPPGPHSNFDGDLKKNSSGRLLSSPCAGWCPQRSDNDTGSDSEKKDYQSILPSLAYRRNRPLRKGSRDQFHNFSIFFYFLSLYFSPSLRQSRSAYSLGKETPRAGTPDTPGLSGRPPTEFGGKDTPNAHASHIREDRKPGHGARHPSRRCSAAAVDSRHIPEPPRRDPWPAPFGSRPQTR